MDPGGDWARLRAARIYSRSGSATQCSTRMGAAFAWAPARPGAGLFSAAHRLYKPRRETPRHEPGFLDDPGRYYPQRSGHHSLLPPAATAAQRLPAMWERSPTGIQLLPSLQLQTEPELSAVPAPGWRK